jgi:hypothetical protein
MGMCKSQGSTVVVEIREAGVDRDMSREKE